MENREGKNGIGCRCSWRRPCRWQRWRLILGGKLPESSLPVAAGVIAGLVAFLGALIAALHSGRRKLLCGLGAAGGYALFLLLGNLLFFGVHYGEALPVLLPLAGAGLLGALLGAGRRKKRRYA